MQGSQSLAYKEFRDFSRTAKKRFSRTLSAMLNYRQTSVTYSLYTVWVKKVAPPIKLFVVLSLLVNLCNLKLPWLLVNCPNMFLCLHQFWSIYLNIFILNPSENIAKSFRGATFFDSHRTQSRYNPSLNVQHKLQRNCSVSTQQEYSIRLFTHGVLYITGMLVKLNHW